MELAGGDDLPPFTGGAVGYVGLRRGSAARAAPVDEPRSGRPSGRLVRALRHDHRVRPRQAPAPLPDAREGGRGRSEESLRKVERARGPRHRDARARGAASGPIPLVRRISSSSVVPFGGRKAKEHIRAGDIFQVVLSRRWSAPFGGDPFAVYRALRSDQPVAVPVLPADAARDDLRGLPGAARARRGGPGRLGRRDDPARGDAAARRDARGGPRPRAGAPRGREGARRARHARRPRPERPRPGLRARAPCA